MIYIKRILFLLLLMIAFIVYPFELCVRFIVTGKDCHNKTLAYKWINKEILY